MFWAFSDPFTSLPHLLISFPKRSFMISQATKLMHGKMKLKGLILFNPTIMIHVEDMAKLVSCSTGY